MKEKKETLKKQKINNIPIQDAIYERLCKRFDSDKEMYKFVNKSINKILNRLDKMDESEKDFPLTSTE